MIALSDDDLQFVAAVVSRAARPLPPQFDRDDLLQAGRLAALQAAMSYDPRHCGGASWRTYAHYRIRGAVLMAARRRNWTEAWHLGLDHAATTPDFSASPLEELAGSDLWRELMAAIERLTNPSRWVVRRRMLDGAAPWRVAKQAHWPIMRVLDIEREAKVILARDLTERGITPATSCLV